MDFSGKITRSNYKDRSSKKPSRIFSLLFALALFLSFFSPLTAFAGTWDGQGGTSTGGSYEITGGGYSVPSGMTNQNVIGYRFTIYDENGKKMGYSIDIDFKKMGYDLTRSYGTTKKSHVDLYKTYKTNEQASVGNLSTAASESNLVFYDSSLPSTPADMEAWLTTNNHAYDIRLKCEATGTPERTYLIVEPLSVAKVDGTNYCMTIAEYAVLQAAHWGWTVTPSTITNNTYSYIAAQLSSIYPYALYAQKSYSALGTTKVENSHIGTNANSGGKAIILPGSNGLFNTAASILQYQVGMGVYTDVVPITYTNTIYHWIQGYKNSEGNNSAKDSYKVQTDTFAATEGSQYTLDTTRAVKIPNGYSIDKFGTSSITGNWQTTKMPYTVTQLAKNMAYDFYYWPNTYKITYELDGGTNNPSNPSTYNVLYGVTFGKPTKTGYTFVRWENSAGKTITGINPGATAKTGTIDAICNAYASRTTGDQTVKAIWTADPYTPYKVNHYLMNTDGRTYTLDSTDSKTGTSDATVTLRNLAKSYTGFTYKEGKVNGSIVTTAKIAADGSLVIDLYYTRNQYTVTLNKGTGISSVSGAGTYYYGASVTINASVSTGYKWVNWTGTHNTTTQKYTFTMPANNVTDTANATTNNVNYTVNHYQMNTSGSYPSSPTGTETKTAQAGSTVTLKDLAKSYSHFAYDYGQANSGYNGRFSTVTTTTISADGSRVINLYYSRNKYTVTLNKGTGISDVSGAGSYYHGASVTINATVANGYTWSKWTGTHETGTQKYTFTMPTSNVTDTANATAIVYKITYNLDGGSLPDGKTNPTTYTIETPTFTLNNPVKSGYSFTGWTGSNGSTPQTSVSIAKGSTGDKSYTANWVRNDAAYKVNHWQQTLTGGSEQNSTNYTLKETDDLMGVAGESVTPAVKSYTGFKAPAAQTVTIKADGTTVVNYYYTRNSYTVTLNKGTGISEVSGGGTYRYGASVTINATVSNGYTWNKWTGTHDTTGQKYSFDMPANNVTDTANATAIVYKITYDLDGGALPDGKTNPTTYTIETATFTLNNPTKSGYIFKGWTGSNGSTPSTSVSVPKGSTGDKSFTAIWEDHIVAYKVNHWQQTVTGGAEQNSTNYTLAETDNLTGRAGSRVTPAVKPYEGFTAPKAQTVTIKADGTTVVDYYYTRNSYTVTLNMGTGISEVSGGGTYRYGASVTINATVVEGYVWSKWTGTHETSTQKYTFVMPARNVTDTANAGVATYTVVYDGNGETGGSTPSSTHTFNEEMNLTPNGFVKEGHLFIGWNRSPDGTGEAFEDEALVKNLTSTPGETVVLYAQWASDAPPVITAVDRWFTLEEARNGDITFTELMSTANAVDGLEGLYTDFDAGEGTFTIIDFSAEEFSSFTKSGSVTITYFAEDFAHNKVYKTVTVYILDSFDDLPPAFIGGDLKKTKIRFISNEYFVDDSGNAVTELNGGFHSNSKWRIDSSYYNKLVNVLSNHKVNGNWSRAPLYSFVLDSETYTMMSEFVETYGYGTALGDFFEAFLE